LGVEWRQRLELESSGRENWEWSGNSNETKVRKELDLERGLRRKERRSERLESRQNEAR